MRSRIESPIDGFNDFDHWWKYIIGKQPTQAIMEVLMDPDVKLKFVNKWNQLVKEDNGDDTDPEDNFSDQPGLGGMY